MPYDLTLLALVFLALWSAIVGGIFWAFSDFIMKALLRADSASGIEVMQQINKTVLGTQFVAGILLIPAFALGLAVYAFGTMTGLPLLMVVLAAPVFMASVFIVTLAGNVPMNNRLGRLEPTSREGADYWEQYGIRWTRLNHIRAIGSLVTALLYCVAVLDLARTGQV